MASLSILPAAAASSYPCRAWQRCIPSAVFDSSPRVWWRSALDRCVFERCRWWNLPPSGLQPTPVANMVHGVNICSAIYISGQCLVLNLGRTCFSVLLLPEPLNPCYLGFESHPNGSGPNHTVSDHEVRPCSVPCGRWPCQRGCREARLCRQQLQPCHHRDPSWPHAGQYPLGRLPELPLDHRHPRCCVSARCAEKPPRIKRLTLDTAPSP